MMKKIKDDEKLVKSLQKQKIKKDRRDMFEPDGFNLLKSES